MPGDGALIRSMIDNLIANNAQLRAAFDKEFPPAPAVDMHLLRLKRGEDVQAAFNSLSPTGGTLMLEPGAHLVNLAVGSRPVDAPLLTVTTDSDTLPKSGRRVAVDDAPGLACITPQLGTAPTLKGLNQSRNVAFVNIAVQAPGVGITTIALGGDRLETPSADVLPQNWTFDRVLVLGSSTTGGHRGIQMHVDGLHIIGCSIVRHWEVGRDSQALSSWNGGRNLLIEDSYLEASCENIMLGGAESASADMTTRDVIIRACRLAKDLAWQSMPKRPSIKSLLEIKNAKKVLVDGCLLENNWAADWPTGVAIMLKACNGDDSLSGSQREVWATAEDITIRDSVIRNVGSVLGLVGYGDSGRVSDRARRLAIVNVLAYAINSGDFKGTGHGCAISNPPDGVTIDHVSMLKNQHSWMNTHTDAGQPAGERLTFTNNLVCNSTYAYISEKHGNGLPAIGADWKANQVAGNVFRAGTRPFTGMPSSNLTLQPADFDGSLDPSLMVKAGSAAAAITTTDGLKPGADVNKIQQALGDLLTIGQP